MVTKRKILTFFFSLAVSLSGLAGITVADLPTALAVANPNCVGGPDAALGTDLVTVSVPTAATYAVWSRIQADAPANNAYYLQIDCGAPITVGGASLTAGAWTWVKYRDGNTASFITAALTAGSHTFNLTGKSSNLMVDRVILSSDAACTPTGTGDNCAAAPTTSPAPSTTPIIGDVNGDGKVNVTDLSLLLSHWGTTYAPTDINHNDGTNVIDLSLLLSHWTG